MPSSATDLISDRAYAELRERIVTLRLAPGTALREDELMSDLAIGRTPLREAIKRLALENLVAVQPRSGTYVTAVEATDIVHISEVRAELEGQAAELAARRLDGAAHTLERFRECFYRPLLSSTENFERWSRNGGQDAAERASRIWRETLERYESPPLDDGVRAQLEEFVVRRRAELGD